MCGIIGYIGNKNCRPFLLDGLKRMEYRGYDSAGIAYVHNNKMNVIKKTGKIINLEKEVLRVRPEGALGIGHTRWATHGEPTDQNAHPHTDCNSKIAVAHNGIIENYESLRHVLEGSGHNFNSETDTEVIAHLIEEQEGDTLADKVMDALPLLKGAYGLVICGADDPGMLIAARLGSPIVLGILDKGEYIVSSDVTALLPYTRQVIYLNDEEVVVLRRDGLQFQTLKQQTVKKKVETIEWDATQAEKQGYPYFMLKEIFEAPEAVRNSLRGRILLDESLVRLGGLRQAEERLRDINRLFITSCGTSYYAGLIGKLMMEECVDFPVEADYASEFRYRKTILDERSAVLAISQSGETADTLAAVREAKRRGALTLGIINVVGSTIAREVDAGVYNHIGPEIGVASTKAFVSQLAILALLAVHLGRSRNMSRDEAFPILQGLQNLPLLLEKILKDHEEIRHIAEKYNKCENFLYLGRKYNYPIALEGALKLKEISYAHAEGYPAGEMKHGPIAMIFESFPNVFIVPQDSVYSKNISNIQEIKARRGKIIAIGSEGDEYIKSVADDVIFIPKILEILTPILAVVPLQLFAYHMADIRGYDIDQPRNLAKSVTVE